MMAEAANYQRLIESIVDGGTLDWLALDAAATTDEERRAYRHLRLVARVAELHRSLGEEAEELSAPTVVEAGAPSKAFEQWGHLTIIERMARGSFGDVYRARDTELQRDVALKLLRTDVKRPLDRMLREARTLARVKHPNVVVVYGADVRDGRPGLWMDLVDGRTLHEWVGTQGSLGPSEASAIGQDVCRALAAVHAAGLVHGDVKAQNVMRENGGRIVLMDFGAGRAQEGATKGIAGTPLYLAPEVLAGEPPTVRSDLYSLGVLLFYLLSGRYPYGADSVDALRDAHAEGARLLLRDIRPDLPGPIVHAIERALDPDPVRRFGSAGDMELALAPAPAVPATSHAAAGRWPPTWIMTAVGLALAAVIALLAGRFSGPAAIGAADVRSVAVFPFAEEGPAGSTAFASVLGADFVRELQQFELAVKRVASGDARGSGDQNLGVQALIHGSIKRADGRTALKVTILRAGDAGEVWSNEYDEPDAELPTMARRVASDLAAAVGTRRVMGWTASHQTNYPAYEAYQRGRALYEQRTPASLMRSVEMFKRAAQLDPDYAEPWAGMADAYGALGVPAFGPLSPREARRLAKEAALAALERNPNLAEAQTSLAFGAYFYDWDWAAAEMRFRKAIELNPQYALAHHWYADFLNAMGRQEEAMKEILLAASLEPLSIIIHRDIAWHLFHQRQYEEAIEHLKLTLAMDADYVPARTLLARALAADGQYPAAFAELKRAEPALSRGTGLSFLGLIQASSGERAGANATLRQLRQTASVEYVSPYYLALIESAMHRPQQTLDELERAYAEQDATLVNVYVDPRFEAFRDDPRFRALLRRMNFPESTQ